jgi:hypothetical protein
MKKLTAKPLLTAMVVTSFALSCEQSRADIVLNPTGDAKTGTVLDWVIENGQTDLYVYAPILNTASVNDVLSSVTIGPGSFAGDSTDIPTLGAITCGPPVGSAVNGYVVGPGGSATVIVDFSVGPADTDGNIGTTNFNLIVHYAEALQLNLATTIPVSITVADTNFLPEAWSTLALLGVAAFSLLACDWLRRMAKA